MAGYRSNQHPADVPLDEDSGRYGIGWLCLSTRTARALKRAGIVDAMQIHYGWGMLRDVSGIGSAAHREIKAAMERGPLGGFFTYELDGTTNILTRAPF